MVSECRGRTLSFFRVGEKLSRADVPQSVVQMVRQGRMTVLAKPDGVFVGLSLGT